MDKQLSITVFYGGISSEREVSLKTGRNIGEALANRGMQVSFCDVTDDFVITPRKPECDVAFIALHGKYGEDGNIQRFFEREGILFTGSSSSSSALAMNKVEAQRVFENAAIPVPRSVFVDLSTSEIPKKVPLEFPVIVKPSREGSTFGITIAKQPDELCLAVMHAAKFDSLVLIEEFIVGREFTVGIVGDMTLPVLEVIPEKEFFTFECKYNGKAIFEFSEDISSSTLAEMQLLARRAYEVAHCSGIARVDFMLSNSGTPYVLEINTIPGMTSRSLVPKAAQKIGISFEELCELAVELARQGTPDRV